MSTRRIPHSPSWRTEDKLRFHKLLTKYTVLWPAKFLAKMVDRGELLTPEQWRIQLLDRDDEQVIR